MTAAVLARISPKLREPFRACAAGEWPPAIAAMHVLREARQYAHVARAARLAEPAAGQGPEGRRLAALLELLRDPEAHRRIRRLFGAVNHSRDNGLESWARAYDRAVVISPEASVAAFSLGDAARLEQATEEVVTGLRRLGLLRPGLRILDVGCGIGRFVSALAPEAVSVTGLDISGGMIAEAQRRCAGLGNVRLLQTDGRGLGALAGQTFDLVLAVDVFPYLVHCGLAEAHVRDAAALLPPGGDLAIFNFAYEGGPDAHDRRLRMLAERYGFALLRAGARDCPGWDGLTWHLRHVRGQASSGSP